VFVDSQIVLFISGSHISAMERLLLSDAPLFGRMTGKLYVPPFEFAEMGDFVPRYSLEKRLAVYSILGGIPDYLQRWDDSAGLMANITDIFLSNLSPYRNEHMVLVSDVLRRDSPDYETVLNVIGSGKHDSADISAYSAIPTNRAANVLKALTELRLVERRIRASVPIEKHEDARHARYFLADPFLQFYYRFVAPNRSKIALGLAQELATVFEGQLRGYVGLAFEALCRRWMLAQAQAGALPFSPEFIGSDWSGPDYQADVVAINWRERQLLVAEAKWTDEAADTAVLTKLTRVTELVVERLRAASPKDRRDLPWQIQRVVFSRHGGTSGLRAAIKTQSAVRLVSFTQVAHDLKATPVKPLR
jgi:AAA+ ATPase superfamily predicted ATPase